ncbi:HutD family protein [Raoultella sp. RIT712]|uniref:HutD/Ves family protein n=1 Tax=Raoultella sp. RIT712 TaxID=2666191 RepID=UPI0012AD7DC6|nr:HutD family protein [Raoultella sp. RIT712]MRT48346.1 HutD family protein [Raoultella sp. RIT712]
MLTSFTFSSLPMTPWKNGGGTTREILCVPSPDPDAPFLWRASIATLQSDGPFSQFTGIDRVIMLLEGEPLWLRGDGINHQLRHQQPWAFPGEWALRSEGITAPGLDFNIMTQRSRASARVSIVSDQQLPGSEGIAWVLQGRWQLAGASYDARSGIGWQGESPGIMRPDSADALLLLAQITRHPSEIGRVNDVKRG